MSYARIIDQMTLIQAIQGLRKFQMSPEPPSLADRQQWIKNIAIQLKNPEKKWIEALAEELQCSAAVIESVEFTGAAMIIESWISRAFALHTFPRGLISILSPRIFPLRMTLERLAPALLAGNVILLKLSSHTPRTSDVLVEILTRAGVPEKVLAVASVSREFLQPFLTAHPAIRGVTLAGKHSSATEIVKGMNVIHSRFQAWTGGTSSFLILDEAGIELAARHLSEAVTSWPSQSPFFPTKIFVLDQFLDRAKEALISALDRVSVATDERFSKTLAQMQSETARILRSQAPALVENLPNCSELQQDELQVPIIQITSVKYSHEMAKWVNNNYYGLVASIFGDVEKAKKLATKLEVGRVLINKAIDPGQSFLFGAKESAVGDTNPSSFYCQSRQISDV